MTLLEAAVAALALGCAAPVVYQNPTTGEIVNCSDEQGAPRDARDGVYRVTPPPSGGAGASVPARPEPAPAAVRFDFEHQCREQLKRDGWTCISGCR